MGIDGIGRGGGPSVPADPARPTGPARGGAAAGAPGKEFSATAVDAAEGVSGAERSEALGKLEKGELSLEQYLDSQVQQATQHLQGRVSPTQLQAIQETLRDELSADPVLIELVKRATGKVLDASEL